MADGKPMVDIDKVPKNMQMGRDVRLSTCSSCDWQGTFRGDSGKCMLACGWRGREHGHGSRKTSGGPPRGTTRASKMATDHAISCCLKRPGSVLEKRQCITLSHSICRCIAIVKMPMAQQGLPLRPTLVSPHELRQVG